MVQEASNTMHDAGVRTRAIQRKLRDMQELPALVIAAVPHAPAEDGSTETDPRPA